MIQSRIRDQLLHVCLAGGDIEGALALLRLPMRERATQFEIDSNEENGYGPDSLYEVAAKMTNDNDTLKAVYAVVEQLNSLSRQVA